MSENEKNVKEIFNYCYEDKFEMEDSEGRRIYINYEIDSAIIDSAVYNILRYNRLDKDIPVEDRKPIIPVHHVTEQLYILSSYSKRLRSP